MSIRKAILILVTLLIIMMAVFTLFYAYQNEKKLEKKSQEINKQISEEQKPLDDKR